MKDREQKQPDKHQKSQHVIERIVEIQKQAVVAQEKTVALLDMTVDLILMLKKVIQAIIFVLFLLVWRVFLSEPFGILFNSMGIKWSALPESYKVVILTTIGMFLSGIFSLVIGTLLVGKIKNILEKNKK